MKIDSEVICGAFLVRKLPVMDLVEKSDLNSMVDLCDYLRFNYDMG